jgi:hypothetical protein
MSEFVVRINDELASRLSRVASERYNGDYNAAISDALLLLFLQPIRPERRRLAQVIYEMREQAKAAGGVSEKDINLLVRECRKGKKANL